MLGVHLTANLAAIKTTGFLKTASNRERPNKSNDLSFPSGHATTAFVHSSLAHQNIALLNVNDTAKTVMQAGVDLAAIGTGWARIEAERHYPTATTIYITPGATAREPVFGLQVLF